MRRHRSGGSSGQGLGHRRAPGQVQEDLVEGGPSQADVLDADSRVLQGAGHLRQGCNRSATGGTRPWATTSIRSPLMARLRPGRRVLDDVAAVGSGREMLLPQWRQGPKPP